MSAITFMYKLNKIVFVQYVLHRYVSSDISFLNHDVRFKGMLNVRTK